MKLFPYILFEKCIYILALEMASPGYRHCASCIGTLSFPTDGQSDFSDTSVTAGYLRTDMQHVSCCR